MKIPFTTWEIGPREQRASKPIDVWADTGWWWTTNSVMANGGSEVTEQSALTYSAVWACVKVISEDLASLPLFVYRKTENSKEKALDHPLYWLLHDAPNKEMTAMQFREAMQTVLLLWGNCFAEIQRNFRGQPVALWPLDPARMKITRPAQEIVYEYQLPDGGKKFFARDDIFHVAGLSFNGVVGLSPIQYHRQTIEAGLTTQQFQNNSTKNGHSLQLVFTHPAPKAPNEDGRKEFAKKIREEYSGSNGQKLGVLWEGMTVKEISQTMADAQFLESKKENVTEICRIFRVPPHIVADLDRATFSNIEHQSLEYVTYCLRPWAVRWEQAINQRLLMESGKFAAEHNMEGLLRGDVASRYSAYAVGRQWGWLSVNDIRQLENMNPIPEGDGYMQPLNMTELGAAPEPMAEPTPAELEQAARALKRMKLIKG